MKKLIRLNSKIILRSPILWIFTGFISLFFLLFVFVIYPDSINYAAALSSMTYIEICIMVLCFCMSVYFSRIKYSVEDIAEVLYAQAVLGRLLSIIIIATIAFFITPFFFVVICSITENTGIRFTAETLVNFFFGWMCIVAISSCFGYILGSVFKKNYIYLIVIPYVIFFSYLNSNFLSLFIDVNSELHLLLTNLFSIQDPFTTGIKLDYVSSMLDCFWLAKKFLLLAFIVLLMTITVIISKKRKRLSFPIAISMLTSIIVLLSSAGIYCRIFPQQYNYEDKLYVISDNLSPYTIDSYFGNINLSEPFTAQCKFVVTKNQEFDEKDFWFRLDKSLVINSLTVDGNEIPFNRSDDYVSVSYNSLPKNNQFVISMDYSGRVYYISDIKCVNIFSTYQAAAFPSSFAFIPIIDGDNSQKNYNFKLHGSNTIISNIPIKEVGNGTYELNGTSDNLCIFMGYFSKFTVDNTIVYRAAYNKKTDYFKQYQNAYLYGHLDPYTQEMIADPIENRPTAFLIYDLYGVLGHPVLYNDYWIMNYGMPS